EIAAYIDSTIYNMQHERAIQAFRIVEKEYMHASDEVKAISEALQKTDRNQVTYSELSQKLESEIIRLGQLKEKYVSSKVNVEQRLPQIFIVDKAVKAERKAVPKRSIIVIVTTFSAFLLSLLGLLIADQLKSER
ncbi:MAG: hypothetical protein JXQ80_01790, partial [Bacteroidales bacterium]|nr:hypothetical protein [Bacteroidales bacterium]